MTSIPVSANHPVPTTNRVPVDHPSTPSRRLGSVRRVVLCGAMVVGVSVVALAMPTSPAHAYGDASVQCGYGYFPSMTYIQGNLPRQGWAYNRSSRVESARLYIAYLITDAGTTHGRFTTGYFTADVTDRGTAISYWRASGGYQSNGMTWRWDTAMGATSGRFDVSEIMYVQQGGLLYGPFVTNMGRCTLN